MAEVTRVLGKMQLDAEGGNKEAGGSFPGEIGKEAAGTGMVTATSGSEKPRGKAEPAMEAVALVTKERVPDSYIQRIKARPMRKIPPLSDVIGAGNPKGREKLLTTNALINYMVDLEQDCLRQYEEKGYAEIGVDYTDGVKKVFILPIQVV